MLSTEVDRLAALNALDILDTNPEEIFDQVTESIAKKLDVPIALISFVDKSRQWFKSIVGLDVDSTPRGISFCTHAIEDSEIFVVEDATADNRFKENPLVIGDPNIRFYAGAPLSIRYRGKEHRVGTLCVIDRSARKLSQDQLDHLNRMARKVVIQLNLRFAKQGYDSFVKKHSRTSRDLN